MNGNAPRFVRLGMAFVGLIALGCVLTGQAAKPAQHGIALPTDWSHSHLVFSQPASAEQAMRMQEDPRFEQQLYRRYQALRLPAAPPESGGMSSSQLQFPRSRHLGGLWEENLGTNATVGAVNFPAKFSFSSGVANCASAPTPDFVVYSSGLAGSGGQASLVAYDNLYAGCTGTVPTVYWAYNTGGQILTSPEFSRDGTQVMFAQTAGGIGSFVLLKWAPSATETVANPGVPTSVTPALYSACVAPCMATIPLEDGSLLTTNDTTSSVFFDYGGDTAWVGDSRGWIHRFNPVFTGTPTEVRTTWPVQVNPGSPLPLASAVFDHGSGNVFVGDGGGFFYRVSAATGTVTQSGQLDFGTGIVAGPLVDSSAGLEYVFASKDGSTACAGGPCAAVYRFASGFGAGTFGAKVTVGASAVVPKPLYEGALDSAYESSASAAGNLYVCGHTGGHPTLYQVQIASGGVLGAVVTGPVLSGSNTGCSPVTHVLNPNATGGATEFIFAGVQTNGTSTPCAAGGCIMNFKDTPWQPSTAYTLGQEIVDSHFQLQIVTTAGTSGTSVPTWATVSGTTTTDGSVKWLDLAVVTAATPAGWQASHAYFLRNYIEDSNQNIEVVKNVAGDNKSGTVQPTWSTTVGQIILDNHVIWMNAGPAPSALASAGGTSGVIIDNTVMSGVSGSQIYFSTQGNQTCTPGSGGNGGCAVQASQSAVK